MVGELTNRLNCKSKYFRLMNLKKIYIFIDRISLLRWVLTHFLIYVVLLFAFKTNAQCGPFQYYTGSNPVKMASDGWVTSGGAWTYSQSSTSARSGYMYISQAVSNTVNPIYIKSPKINTPKTFSFWAKSKLANSNCSLSFSDDNGATWTNISNGATTLSTTLNPAAYSVSSAIVPVLSTTWQLITVTAAFPSSPNGYYFKINDARANGTVGTLCLDDFSWESSIENENNIVTPIVTSSFYNPSNGVISVPTAAVYHFYDVGGSDDNYSNGQVNNVTFTPVDPAYRIKVSFVATNYNLASGDKIVVFDNTAASGATILGSPFFGANPLTIPYISSLSSDGSLTVQFVSNGTYVSTAIASQSDGYELLIECSSPVCQLPTAIPTISNITSSTATIHWTGISPGYEFAATLTNSPPIDSGTYTTAVSGVVSGLVPETFYYGWVRSNCGPSFYSDWVMSTGFTTLCAPTSVPYVEDFTGLDYDLPHCTTSIGGDWQTNLSSSKLIGSASGSMFFTKPLALSSGTTYNLSYDFAALLGTADFDVYIGKVNDTSIMIPANKLFSHVGVSAASSNSFNFTKANGIYYIGFYLASTSNASTTFLSLDNIVVDCVTPIITASATSICVPNTIVAITGSGTSGFKWATSAGVLYTNAAATWLYIANSNVKTVYLKSSVTAIVTLTGINGVCNKSTTQTITFKSTTWDGTAWSDGIPDSATQVIFNGNYSSIGNLNACSVIVQSGNVVFNSGHSLIVQNTVKLNAGSLTFENNASLVQINNVANATGIYSGGNTGAITYKRNTTPIRKHDYTYWSTPVSTQTLGALSPLTLSDKYMSYDAFANNWVILSPTSVMVPGKGYLVRGPQTYDVVTPQVYNASFVGVPNNGTITTPINGANNLNLIGNPYPSALSADLFLSNASNVAIVEATIYLWTHNTPITNNNYSPNDYAVYNYLGGVGTTAAPSGSTGGFNNSIPNGKIASGQSFFIKGVTNGNATFLNSMRLTGNNNQFFRIANPSKSVTEQNHRIWLEVKNEQGAYKQTLIGYSPKATMKIDRGYDGEVINADGTISVYSIAENKSLAIQGRPLPFSDTDEVVLGFSTTTSGCFSINLNDFDGLFLNQEIYLKDNMLNKTINLKKASYTFKSDKGVFNDRFLVVYRDSSLQRNSKQFKSEDVIIFKPNQEIYVASGTILMNKIRVFDVRGSLLLEKNDVDSNQASINLGTTNQLLLIEITATDGTIITKKYVN
jgi:hypothetical protein